MKSIKSILDKYHISKTTAGITVLSLLALPIIPLTAFAVSDVTPPSVSITVPTNGMTVSGTVSISANATDLAIPASDCLVTISGVQYDVTSLQSPHPGGNIFVCGTDMTTVYIGQHGTSTTRMAPYTIPQSGISKVELWIDGGLNQTSTSSPFTFTWNSATVSNGTHAIIVKAFDLSNNQASSTVVTVTTNNTVVTPPSVVDTIAPTVSITTPADNSTTTKKLNITTSATDNVGVTKVELYVDGVLKTSTTTAPYTFTLNKSGIKKGVHTLTLKAYDAAGNVGISSAVKVTVTGKSMKIHHDNERDNENRNEHKNKQEKKEKKEHHDRRENNSFGKSHSSKSVENDD